MMKLRIIGDHVHFTMPNGDTLRTTYAEFKEALKDWNAVVAQVERANRSGYAAIDNPRPAA